MKRREKKKKGSKDQIVYLGQQRKKERDKEVKRQASVKTKQKKMKN